MAHILVIDDEPNICRMIQLTLEAAGHSVETAYEGIEGLTKFGTGEGWDLVLLDQRMPGLEGLEVLREIKKRAPDTKVIMITAFGTIDLAVTAMKEGATDFLRKPFTSAVLKGAVEAALNRQMAPPSSQEIPLTYGFTTVNGFHIEYNPSAALYTGGKFSQPFTVHSPAGETGSCTVVLQPHVIELVKAYTNREHFSDGYRFWQALCEEALANYLWQNATLPPEELQVDDLTKGMRRWIDAVLPTI